MGPLKRKTPHYAGFCVASKPALRAEANVLAERVSALATFHTRSRNSIYSDFTNDDEEIVVPT
jgi:hypothetical protein